MNMKSMLLLAGMLISSAAIAEEAAPQAPPPPDMEKFAASVKEQAQAAAEKKRMGEVCLTKELAIAVTKNLGSQPWANVNALMLGLQSAWPKE